MDSITATAWLVRRISCLKDFTGNAAWPFPSGRPHKTTQSALFPPQPNPHFFTFLDFWEWIAACQNTSALYSNYSSSAFKLFLIAEEILCCNRNLKETDVRAFKAKCQLLRPLLIQFVRTYSPHGQSYGNNRKNTKRNQRRNYRQPGHKPLLNMRKWKFNR